MKRKLLFERTILKILSLRMIFPAFILVLTSSCDFKKNNQSDADSKPARKGTYVSPSVDYRGRVRKGHFRKAYSTDKNAVKNQARSRYYYHTRGKYKKSK